jgi:excisionase family DNA binding protein
VLAFFADLQRGRAPAPWHATSASRALPASRRRPPARARPPAPGIAEFVVDRAEGLRDLEPPWRVPELTSADADADERSCPSAQAAVCVGATPSRAATPADGRLLVTPEQAAQLLSIGRTSVYELISRGELQSVRIGRCRRVPVSSLVGYVRGLVERAERG